MPEYRKRPVVIEAWQWNPGDMEDAGTVLGSLMAHGAEFECADGMGDETTLAILTLEGTMTAKAGDWIIKGVLGEFYPCARDVFAATYEPVPPLGCRCAEILAEGGDWTDCPVHAEADEAFVSVDHA